MTRRRRAGVKPVRSVVGTVRLPADDPDLSKAKAAVRALFEESLSRPLDVREPAEPYGAKTGLIRGSAARRRRRG